MWKQRDTTHWVKTIKKQWSTVKTVTVGYHQSNSKNQLSAKQVTKPVNDENKNLYCNNTMPVMRIKAADITDLLPCTWYSYMYSLYDKRSLQTLNNWSKLLTQNTWEQRWIQQDL